MPRHRLAPAGFFALALLFGQCLPGSASAVEVRTAPLLRIDTVMHTARIQRIAVDAPGRYLVTASYDKTARVWSLATGELLTVLRPPADGEQEGKIGAVAMSPDGETVAVGGWLRYGDEEADSIYLFSRATGEVVRRIAGVPARTLHLAYSNDGKYLAAGLAGTAGVAVYEGATGRIVGQPTKGLRSVFGLSWHGERLAATDDDGKLQLWRMSANGLEKLREVGTGKDRRPYSVAFSPDGSLLAVGYQSAATISVVDGETLESRHELSIAKPNTRASLAAVAWSQDGKWLYGAGRYEKKFDVGWRHAVRRWERRGKEWRWFDRGVARDSIYALAPLPRGRLAYASVDPAWGVLDGAMKAVRHVTAETLRFSRDDLLVSADGMRVGAGKIGFSVAGRQLTPPSDLLPPRTQADGLAITDWKNSYSPRLNGIPLRLRQQEESRRLAISPDATGFILGAEWTLRRFDRDGRAVWVRPAATTVWGVGFTADGKTVVVAYADGTVRWHRYSDGIELLALFIDRDGKEWVLWTPEGYYDASPGGARLIGWQINQGAEREARFVPGNQLYDVFYRPDIVQATLRGEDSTGLITISAAEAVANPPPTIRFTRMPGSSGNPREKICYRVTSSGGGIGEIRVFHNGKLVKSDGFYRDSLVRRPDDTLQLAAANGDAIYRDLRALKRLQPDRAEPQTPRQTKPDTVDECQEIEALPGDNELGVAAFNAQNTVQSAIKTATFSSTVQAEPPRLYVLAIGIDRFKDASADLKFAAKDAFDFARTIAERAVGVFAPQNIHVEHLVDAEANKAGILGRLDRFATNVRPWDSFVLFIASHGVLMDNQYYIVTSGYGGTADPAQLISTNEIVDLSKKTRALSQLFIFDTCHAGGVDNIVSGLYDARMSLLAKNMGLHVFASAGGLQEALDGYQGNGLFTHALLAGMRNAAETDLDHDGRVSMVELGANAKQKTASLSAMLGRQQTPTIIDFGRDGALFKAAP